jgi:hypothetical protein
MAEYLSWRKRCSNGACVEVAVDDKVRVRSSKDPATQLIFTPRDWKAFLGSLKAGKI